MLTAEYSAPSWSDSVVDVQLTVNCVCLQQQVSNVVRFSKETAYKVNRENQDLPLPTETASPPKTDRRLP